MAIVSFLTSIYGIGGILAGIVLVVITILIKNAKKNKYKREIRIYAEDKVREERLDHVILNSHEGNVRTEDESVPYDVDYGLGTQNVSGAEYGSVSDMIQLIEHSELSSRKHVLNARKGIMIGSQRESNNIVVPGTAAQQCQIFCYQNGVFLREVAGNNLTILQRRKKRVYVQKSGVQLKNGDLIILNDIYFEVMLNF